MYRVSPVVRVPGVSFRGIVLLSLLGFMSSVLGPGFFCCRFDLRFPIARRRLAAPPPVSVSRFQCQVLPFTCPCAGRRCIETLALARS